MRKNKKGNPVLYGAVVLIVLFVVAIAVVIDFTRENEETVTELYSDNMGRVVELYAEKTDNIFDSVRVSADTAVRLLEICIVGENTWTREALDSIVDSSAAYGVVYYKNDTSMVTSSGLRTPDVSAYKGRMQGTKHFFHVEDDGISGTPAFVYSVPVKKGNSYRGYLLTYISDEAVREIFKESPAGIDVFYSIVDDSGDVPFLIDVTEGTGYFDGGIWNNIENYAAEASQWEQFNDSRMKKAYSSVSVDMDGERRTVYISPVAGGTWLFVTGVGTGSIENKGIALWEQNNQYQNVMYVILAGMLVTIAAVAGFSLIGARKSKKELENKADTDQLAGISNKIAAENQIREYIEQNPQGRAVMIIMDIDNFKKINDTRGHAFGDEVIRQVANQLRSMLGISDVVGRMGGDEFVVLMKDIQDASLIEKECRMLESCFHRFEVGEYAKYSVTASLGAAVFPQDAQTYEQLYKAADSALYAAKRRGKNQLAFYSREESAEEENK